MALNALGIITTIVRLPLRAGALLISRAAAALPGGDTSASPSSAPARTTPTPAPEAPAKVGGDPLDITPADVADAMGSQLQDRPPSPS